MEAKIKGEVFDGSQIHQLIKYPAVPNKMSKGAKKGWHPFIKFTKNFLVTLRPELQKYSLRFS